MTKKDIPKVEAIYDTLGTPSDKRPIIRNYGEMVFTEELPDNVSGGLTTASRIVAYFMDTRAMLIRRIEDSS